MMKQLLLTAASGLFVLGAYAQCTPDPNYHPGGSTGAGISDLPCAIKDQPYNESATIVIPQTVTATVQGATLTVRPCKVTLTSIDNFPANNGVLYPIVYNGTTYGLGDEITLVTGVDRGCVNVQGTFTAVYGAPDSLRVQGTVKVSLNTANCNNTQPFPISALSPGGLPIGFNVRNTQAECDALMSIEETISNNSFDVAQNFPNPFNGESQIAFNMPQAGKVNFRVTNLVGQVVKENTISANSGMNYITVNSAEYAAGVYMYSISANGKVVTKRMIIK